MLLFGSWNAVNAMPAAMQILKEGGTALDAVEAAIRVVEADPDEHSVGVGGWPNVVGEVELDASIMDGRNRATGAVGALRGYPHPISVARRVMERLPHVFLVGQGAADFAKEMGFPQEEILTNIAAKEWIERVQVNVPVDQIPDLLHRRKMAPWVNLAKDPQRIHGTINVIAVDSHGDIASGVSTSGWFWKYPGRLGDSPIIGAGNYCDNRYGAAACIGHGELAIRAGTARTVVLLLQMGVSLLEACRQAMLDLPEASDEKYGSFVSIVAVDNRGNHCGISNAPEHDEFAYMSADMQEGELRRGTIVDTGGQE